MLTVMETKLKFAPERILNFAESLLSLSLSQLVINSLINPRFNKKNLQNYKYAILINLLIKKLL